MNPAQKLAFVEHQIRQAALKNISSIDCPYCGFTIPAGAETLCCDLMGEAVAAILHRMETNDQLDAAARIAEGAERQAILN